MSEHTTLLQQDDTAVYLYRWEPEGEVRGVVQIVHGMAEHAARYARLAAFLNEAGWAVMAHDQRGHGQTAHSVRDLGFFAEEDGWAKVVEDVRAVTREARSLHPDAPVVLLGHSMGSYIVQSVLMEDDDYAAAILTGSTLNQGLLVRVGRQLARLEKWRIGGRGVSGLLQRLSIGGFQRAIPNRRTDSDWLSRDPAEVDKYEEDPLCGFPVTAGLWVDLTQAFRDLEDPECIRRIRDDLPLRIMSGAEDPVNNGGAGFHALVGLYQDRGMKRLESDLFEGARHEIFNETNRDEVMGIVRDWLDEVVPREG